MRTNKFFLTGFLIFTLSWLFPLSLYAQSQSDPVGLLQYIANNMIAQLKSHQATLKTKPQIVYNLAYEYVVPYADLDEMSKRVLPRQTWNQATSSQRERFKKQFTTLLIRTYASALTSYRDQTVRFYPVRGGAGGTVQVSSDIVSPESQPIHVTYRLCAWAALGACMTCQWKV